MLDDDIVNILILNPRLTYRKFIDNNEYKQLLERYNINKRSPLEITFSNLKRKAIKEKERMNIEDVKIKTTEIIENIKLKEAEVINNRFLSKNYNNQVLEEENLQKNTTYEKSLMNINNLLSDINLYNKKEEENETSKEYNAVKQTLTNMIIEYTNYININQKQSKEENNNIPFTLESTQAKKIKETLDRVLDLYKAMRMVETSNEYIKQRKIDTSLKKFESAMNMQKSLNIAVATNNILKTEEENKIQTINEDNSILKDILPNNLKNEVDIIINKIVESL